MLSQPYHHGKPGMLAFHPGMPDPDNFPFNTWARLLSRRAKLAHLDLFGTYHVKGYPPLCEAIARYLTASRGVKCEPEQIVVTNGAQSAFDLLARILIDDGDAVWMEEPGYYGAGSAFVSAGAKLSPLHVNDGRLEPRSARRPRPRLIFVTPSCHHPLGMTMPMEQRLKLLHLAEAWNAWIIEDDFDGEYRFQGQPIPALQGISASNRVVYVGTFAKVLFPAMRLGFLVVPEPIRDSIISALSVTGQFAPLLTQAALADFMNEGHFTRHLRRMRRLYAERRPYFLERGRKISRRMAAFPRHASRASSWSGCSGRTATTRQSPGPHSPRASMSRRCRCSTGMASPARPRHGLCRHGRRRYRARHDQAARGVGGVWGLLDGHLPCAKRPRGSTSSP